MIVQAEAAAAQEAMEQLREDKAALRADLEDKKVKLRQQQDRCSKLEVCPPTHSDILPTPAQGENQKS